MTAEQISAVAHGVVCMFVWFWSMIKIIDIHTDQSKRERKKRMEETKIGHAQHFSNKQITYLKRPDARLRAGSPGFLKQKHLPKARFRPVRPFPEFSRHARHFYMIRKLMNMHIILFIEIFFMCLLLRNNHLANLTYLEPNKLKSFLFYWWFFI